MTSPPSPGIIGVLREVLDALPAPKGNLLSYGVDREADDVAGRLPAVEPQPLVECRVSCSRSMPESFQGLRYPESRDSILAKEALEALLEACLKSEPGELDPFLRRSRKDENDEMLPGFRSLSKIDR